MLTGGKSLHYLLFPRSSCLDTGVDSIPPIGVECHRLVESAEKSSPDACGNLHQRIIAMPSMAHQYLAQAFRLPAEQASDT